MITDKPDPPSPYADQGLKDNLPSFILRDFAGSTRSTSQLLCFALHQELLPNTVQPSPLGPKWTDLSRSLQTITQQTIHSCIPGTRRQATGLSACNRPLQPSEGKDHKSHCQTFPTRPRPKGNAQTQTCFHSRNRWVTSHYPSSSSAFRPG